MSNAPYYRRAHMQIGAFGRVLAALKKPDACRCGSLTMSPMSRTGMQGMRAAVKRFIHSAEVCFGVICAARR